MDAFSYLSVLLSIILGLAITQLLTGIRGIVLARERVVLFIPSLVWMLFLIVLDVQAWWAMFALHRLTSWTFAAFSIVLLETLALYLLAALVLPDFPPGEAVDLRVHFFAHTRVFFGLFVALLGVSLIKSVFVNGGSPGLLDVAWHAAFIVGAILGACIRRERFHQVLAPLMLAALVGYIAVLFTRLP